MEDRALRERQWHCFSVSSAAAIRVRDNKHKLVINTREEFWAPLEGEPPLILAGEGGISTRDLG